MNDSSQELSTETELNLAKPNSSASSVSVAVEDSPATPSLKSQEQGAKVDWFTSIILFIVISNVICLVYMSFYKGQSGADNSHYVRPHQNVPNNEIHHEAHPSEQDASNQRLVPPAAAPPQIITAEGELQGTKTDYVWNQTKQEEPVKVSPPSDIPKNSDKNDTHQPPPGEPGQPAVPVEPQPYVENSRPLQAAPQLEAPRPDSRPENFDPDLPYLSSAERSALSPQQLKAIKDNKTRNSALINQYLCAADALMALDGNAEDIFAGDSQAQKFARSNKFEQENLWVKRSWNSAFQQVKKVFPVYYESIFLQSRVSASQKEAAQQLYSQAMQLAGQDLTACVEKYAEALFILGDRTPLKRQM